MTLKKWLKDVEIVVTLPAGGTHRLDVNSQASLDLAIAIELATFMTARSYWEGEVLVGSFLFDQRLSRPANGWFEWLQQVRLFDGSTEQQRLEFAVRQMQKANDWYAR